MSTTRRTESGLTLIELVIAVVLLSLLAGALSTVFVTAFHLSGTDKGRIAQSDDSQAISAYLVRDAQAAGGTNPRTAQLDTTLGVSKTDDAGCTNTTPGASLRLRFKWLDRNVVPDPLDPTQNIQVSRAHVANYYWVPATLVGSVSTPPQLVRTTCEGGLPPSTPVVSSALGNSVAAVVASCDPECDATNPSPGRVLPDTVSLTMTATPNPPAASYQYTVSASLRPEGQTPPCSTLEDPACPGDSGTSVPLLALGGGPCSGTNPLGVGVDGNTTAHIYGGVIIDAANAGGCKAMDCQGNPTYTSGTISILNGGTDGTCPFPTSSYSAQVLDPFADLAPPPDTCSSGGGNPTPTTINGIEHYPATTYPNLLTISDTDAVFDSGPYVFCAGLSFAAGTPSAKFKQPLATNAGAITTVTVDDTSGFNSAGGTFLLLHLGYPYYFTYTGVDSVNNKLTGVALVAGQSIVQFALDDPVAPAATSAPGGVLFYVKGGTISKTGGASVALSPLSSGDYAGLLIWQRAVDTTTPMSFQGNGPLNLNGTLYAPSIEVVLAGTVDTAVKSIIAAKVTFTGNHTVGIGVPPPPLVIATPATLPDWTAGVPYPSTTVTATGGTGSNTFSATGLPATMSISAAGVISGTPNTSGIVNATIIVTDSFGDVATKGYTFTINPGPVVNPGTLPNWTTGRTYPGTAITGTGGTTPYTWSAANLPAGLAINPSTGIVSGKPTSAVTTTSTATITLTDFTGATATRDFTLTINATPSVTGPPSLPDWTVNQAYPNQTMTRANGTTPFTWSASGLPSGLSITTAGVISGTPDTAGTYNASVTVTDLAGASDTKNYTVTINPVPSIATGAIPNGEQGRPYSFTLTSSGGTPPYTWSLANGANNALPPGLSLDTSTGVISGTPTSAGAYTPKITATDSTGSKSTSVVYNFVIAQPIAITGPASLPVWTMNRAYPATAIVATDGVSPFVWSVTPAMPAGMSIDPATGVVSGTPTVSGTFNVTIKVTDAQGGTASTPYSIVINQNPAISTGSPLPDGVQTVSYSTTVVATLGTPYVGGVYHWSVSGLPTGSGLGIGLTTGVLSGTPAVSGTFTIQISAQDSTGATASKSFTLSITPPPSLSSVSPNALAQGATSKNVTITGANFATGAQVTFSGNGITVNSTTFVDSSTLTANVTIAGGATTGLRSVTETNPDGSTGTFTNAFTVDPAPTVASANPSSRGRGATNQDITITGTNFASGAQVTFSGAGITVNSTIFNTATTLTANITISAGAATGARNVTVTNSDAGTATKTNAFTVNAGPTFTSTVPNAHAQGLVNQSILVTGTGFVSGATVSFSGSGITVNTTTFNTATQITVSVTIAGNATVGPRDVTVTNPDGGSATGAGSFTVDATPTITAITPNTGPNLSAGPETIDGTGFAPGATVTFAPAGATAPTAASVVVNGPGTQITFSVTVPQDVAAPRTYDVTVTNSDGGSATLVGAFTVT